MGKAMQVRFKARAVGPDTGVVGANLAVIGVDHPFTGGIMLPDLAIILVDLAVEFLTRLALLGLCLASHGPIPRRRDAADHREFLCLACAVPV